MAPVTSHARILTTAFGLLLLGALPAHAQINPFRSSAQGQGLTEADRTMLMDSAAHLNAADAVKVGDIKDWANPATGNAGSVAVTRLFEYHGMACHSLRYYVSVKAKQATRTYNVDWCKTKAGEWKIKS